MSRAIQKARELHQKYSPNDCKAPVEKIANKLGVQVVRQELNRMAGMLVREGDRKYIAVNDADPPERQRFTIAHELGHLLLHRGRPVIVDHSFRVNFRDENSSTATDREEIQANQFAAELLMPSEAVKDEYRQITDRSGDIDLDELVETLAERFEVSRMAMMYRLANLGLSSLP